jgi:hypothetical protein
MADTFTKIATITVGSGGAATMAFTSIPQTYTDLCIKMSARGTNTNGETRVTFNAISANYDVRVLYGDGSTAASTNYLASTTLQLLGSNNRSSSGASIFSSTELYIPNYAGSTNKSLLVDAVTEDNVTSGSTTQAGLHVGLSANTAAITSVTLAAALNFAQYSTATLYGVTSLGAGAKATGGMITSDTNYWYHTFRSSGTFTPLQSLTCDYLVVAGGGAGGWDGGGGGGAGGLRSTVTATGGGGSLETPLSLSATGYTVTVGAGGAATTTSAANGSNSVFSTITSTGGGAGRDVANAGITGGSGGGGGMRSTAGGTGTANQGYAGGRGAGSTVDGAAGGGGGAGAVGANFISTTIAGAGGAGVATSITGSSVTYAGGGGGSCRYVGSATPGAGGAGGGGAGAASGQVGTAATPNTGSGGGGGAANAGIAGGNGGSGIVIVRYAK